VKRSLKDAAKKGHMDVCKILGKEILQSRKAQSKLHAAKAHMSSIQMQMKNQLGKYYSVYLKIFAPAKELSSPRLGTAVLHHEWLCSCYGQWSTILG